MNQITLKLKPEMKRRLKEIADSEGLSISDVVRLALREKLRSPFFYSNKCDLNNRKNAKKGN